MCVRVSSKGQQVVKFSGCQQEQRVVVVTVVSAKITKECGSWPPPPPPTLSVCKAHEWAIRVNGPRVVDAFRACVPVTGWLAGPFGGGRGSVILICPLTALFVQVSWGKGGT